MNVNSNLTASPKNKKKLPVSKYFPFTAGDVDTGDQPLLSNISENFHTNFEMAPMGFSGAQVKLIHEKKLRSGSASQSSNRVPHLFKAKI